MQSDFWDGAGLLGGGLWVEMTSFLLDGIDDFHIVSIQIHIQAALLHSALLSPFLASPHLLFLLFS